MVTVWGPLVLPTRMLPKLKLTGLTSMAGATPVPESETVGEPASLTTVTVSPARPVPAGVKVTSKVTKLPGAMGESAGRLKAKPAAPPRVIELTVRSAVPVFVMVTVWGPLVAPTRTLPKLKLVGLTSIAGAMPVPLKLTEAGPASLAIETVSPAAPTASGAKVTSKVTRLPGAMGESAGRLRAKPAAPPRLMELTVRSALPVLLMVTVCGPLVAPTMTLPKLKLAGLTSMAGATPVPLRRTEAPPASLLIEMVSPTAPAARGAKVTSKVMRLPGAMGEGAGRLGAKPAAPPRVMLEAVRSAEPVFVIVTVCGPLVLPTKTLPKAIEGGATLMAGAMPVPERLTVGEPA